MEDSVYGFAWVLFSLAIHLDPVYMFSLMYEDVHGLHLKKSEIVRPYPEAQNL